MAEEQRPEYLPGDLALPDFVRWPTFPFEGQFRVRPVQPSAGDEPPRQGEGGVDCAKCAAPDSEYLWVDERWRVRALGRPSGLPAVVVLETRGHYDLGDLSNLLAAELGVMTVRLERGIRSLPNVARVHVNRWGDGSEHLHVFFLARPKGLLQLRGTFLSMWDDILPPIPEHEWRENLAFIAAWMSEYSGEAVAAPPPLDWPPADATQPAEPAADVSGPSGSAPESTGALEPAPVSSPPAEHAAAQPEPAEPTAPEPEQTVPEAEPAARRPEPATRQPEPVGSFHEPSAPGPGGQLPEPAAPEVSGAETSGTEAGRSEPAAGSVPVDRPQQPAAHWEPAPAPHWQAEPPGGWEPGRAPHWDAEPALPWQSGPPRPETGQAPGAGPGAESEWGDEPEPEQPYEPPAPPPYPRRPESYGRASGSAPVPRRPTPIRRRPQPRGGYGESGNAYFDG